MNLNSTEYGWDVDEQGGMFLEMQPQAYVNLGRSGLHPGAISLDIQQLIRAYEMKQSVGYPDFSSIWREMGFSLIQFGCCDPNEKENYMQILYKTTLGYLILGETLFAQVGAIYTLYLLYFTQPTIFKKIPIRLTLTAWRNLELLYNIGFDHDMTDMIFVIHKLRDQSAFVYVAQNHKVFDKPEGGNVFLQEKSENALIRLEKELNTDILVPTDALLTDISKLAADYNKAKADLASVSLARRSSQIVMGHLRKMKTPDLNPREANPVPRFLRQHGGYVGYSEKPSTQLSTLNTPLEATDLVKGSSDIDMADVRNTSYQSLQTADRSSHNSELSSVIAESEVSSSRTAQHESLENNQLAEESSTKDPHVRLPFVFPMSMLQATKAEFPVELEELVKRYHRDRMARFEFAASGDLPRNNYSFTGASLVGKRKKRRRKTGVSTTDRA